MYINITKSCYVSDNHETHTLTRHSNSKCCSETDQILIHWMFEAYRIAKWCSHIKFADRTACAVAQQIIPRVRMTTPEMHARLLYLTLVIRLSCSPVGERHRRYSIAVSICGCHSPDERGLGTWIYTLPGCPIICSKIRMRITSSQCSSVYNNPHQMNA